MKKTTVVFLLTGFLGLCTAATALAQGTELTLSLSRDWGYGGLNGDIQGTFSMKAGGPDNLTRVEFFIDDTKIGEATSAPFRLQFVTDNFPPGRHSLHATGITNEGTEIDSQPIQATFVTASEGAQGALGIIIPVLVIIFGAMALAAVVPILLGRRTVSLPPGAPRSYRLGGGICPRCGRPFGFHLFGLNVIGRKFDRCPYCGRWGLVGYTRREELRAAEQTEIEAAKEKAPESGREETARKELDDSKYQDL
jgi:hypothetical protein